MFTVETDSVSHLLLLDSSPSFCFVGLGVRPLALFQEQQRCFRVGSFILINSKHPYESKVKDREPIQNQ